MNNKKNNKGFSLVELIVVVAIMAVLVGVLAPTYLRYVEKTRAQKDVSAVAEVIEAAKIACAEEKVYDGITASTTIVVADEAAPTSADADLQAAIQEIVDEIDFTSKAYDGKQYTIKFTVDTDATTGAITAVNVAEYDADDATVWTTKSAGGSGEGTGTGA